MIKGVDVSHWNIVDWVYLWNLGHRFAWIKVSEGTGFEDPAWEMHYKEATEAGFYVGPYHWLTPYLNGTKQFDWHKSLISKVDWHFPTMSDVEEESTLDDLIYYTRVRSFNDASWNYWGRRPVLYTSADKWNRLCGGRVLDADLCVAHWTTRPTPFLPKGFADWKFWQHDCDEYDFERFNGNEEDFRKYAGIVQLPIYEIKEDIPETARVITVQLTRK